MLFDEFLKIYKTAFTNNAYSLKHIKDNFKSYKIQSQDNNVFLYENDMILYFVNDIKKYNLQKSFAKVIAKNDDTLNKHDEFLKLNDFYLLDEYIYMSLNSTKDFSKSGIFVDSFDDARVFGFLSKYFKSYTLDKNYIKQKLTNKECLIYIKNSDVYGVLVFSCGMSGVFVDYLAVDRSCGIKNLAYLLLCELCYGFSKKLSLFVDSKNTHAIEFYKRFGFIKVYDMKMRFYKKD